MTVEEFVIKSVGCAFIEPAFPDGFVTAILFKGLATTDSDKQFHGR